VRGRRRERERDFLVSVIYDLLRVLMPRIAVVCLCVLVRARESEWGGGGVCGREGERKGERGREREGEQKSENA